MPTLIRYNDGVTVQVAQNDPAKPVAFAGVGAKVEKQFDTALKLIEPLLKPLHEVMARSLQQNSIGEAQVKLGLSFSVEGNVYLSKVSGEANLEVTITYKK